MEKGRKKGEGKVAMKVLLSRQFWRMAILWLVSLLYSYLLLSFSFLRRACPRLPPPTLPGSSQLPICVITGATSGLGAAAARALSRKGYLVVLAGRSMELLSKIEEDIKKQNSLVQLKAFQVDMLSFNSILKFKNSLQDWLLESNLHPSVQLLINNAGILATSTGVTSDGYDRMIKTNYVGAFVLTNLLLPLLKNSPVASRIVNVSSFTHRCVFSMPSITKQNVKYLSGGSYPFAQIYECSKLYMLLFSYELHQKFYLLDPSCKISVMAADPGVVKTNIMRELPQHISKFAFFALDLVHLSQSPGSGVASIIDAALAPPGNSGEYFFGGGGRRISSSALSYNSNLAKDLWAISMKLLQESFAIQDER